MSINPKDKKKQEKQKKKQEKLKKKKELKLEKAKHRQELDALHKLRIKEISREPQ